MAVGDRAQRAADAGLGEEDASPATMIEAMMAAAMSSFCKLHDAAERLDR